MLSFISFWRAAAISTGSATTAAATSTTTAAARTATALAGGGNGSGLASASRRVGRSAFGGVGPGGRLRGRCFGWAGSGHRIGPSGGQQVLGPFGLIGLVREVDDIVQAQTQALGNLSPRPPLITQCLHAAGGLAQLLVGRLGDAFASEAGLGQLLHKALIRRR